MEFPGCAPFLSLILFNIYMYEKPKATRYILYARKSTENDDRQVSSIEDQISMMRKKAQEMGLNIIKTLSESKSAYKTGRREFALMIKMLKEGKADGIICWSMSRLARNIMDAAPIIDMLQNGKIKHIRCSSEDWYPETDVTRLYFEFGITNQFSKTISVDTIRGIERKANRGWFPFASVPLGYCHRPPKQIGDIEIYNDPERFEIIKHLFHLMLKGGMTGEDLFKVATIQFSLKARNGKLITRSPFYRILNSKFYYGSFEYPNGSGTLVQGKHEAMITEHQFNTIQGLLHKNRTSSGNASHLHEFTGLFSCASCGYAISAEKTKKTVQKSGEIQEYEYYHCVGKHKVPGCRKTYVEVKELKKQLIEVFDSIRVPKALLVWGIEQLSSEIFQKSNIQNTSKDILLCSISEIEQKQDDLLDLLLNKTITQEKYEKKNAQYLAEIEENNKLVANFKDPMEELRNRSESFGKDLKKRFFEGDKAKKREILFSLGSNHVFKDKKVHLTVNPIIKLFATAPDDLKEYSERIEPMQGPGNWTQIGDLIRENVTWGG